LTQVVNGPFDADKLDYQARDGYFTGIAFRVDLERLLASICVVREDGGDSYLAVDHRGVAAIEQLLFNRMLLFDSVYHHHKNRAAVRFFRSVVQQSNLLNLDWFLTHDESDFFAGHDLPEATTDLVVKLRNRDLPHRAAVLNPSTVVNSEQNEFGRMAAKYFSLDPKDRDQVAAWIQRIRQGIATSLNVDESTILLDLPSPPKYQELQRQTFIQYAGRKPILLDQIFPFTSAVNSYAQQCKYRIYLFAWRDRRDEVAAAAFKVFKQNNVILNKEAFRLAGLNPDAVANLAGEAIPERSNPPP
jgi:HD superfamily phosphohydrolase